MTAHTSRGPVLRGTRGTATLAVAGVLLVVALVGLTTDVFRSRRSIVRGALESVLDPGAYDVSARASIRLPGAKQDRVSFAGSGLLLREEGGRTALDAEAEVRVRRRGLELVFDMLLRSLDGAWYLQFRELPATEELEEALSGVWLRLTEPRTGDPPSPEDLKDTLQIFTENDVATDIARRGRETVGAVRAVRYELALDEEALARAAQTVGESAEEGAAKNLALRTAGILGNFTVRELSLWVTPRAHDLVRARLVASPRADELKDARVTVDITRTPHEGDAPSIGHPDDSRKFRRLDLIFRIFGLNF